MNLKYKIAKYQNNLPYYGEVELKIEIIESGKLEIINNNKEIWNINGYKYSKEDVSKWRIGVQKGIEYAFRKLINIGIKVSIVEVNILLTDSNPTILAFITSRIILNKFENNETKEDLDKFEKLMISSHKYPKDYVPKLDI